MKDVTITLNADGTFAADGKELTLRNVITLARERREAANAVKKAERTKKANERKAKRVKKATDRAEKLVAELKELGTDQAVIDGLVAKLSA